MTPHTPTTSKPAATDTMFEVDSPNTDGTDAPAEEDEGVATPSLVAAESSGVVSDDGMDTVRATATLTPPPAPTDEDMQRDAGRTSMGDDAVVASAADFTVTADTDTDKTDTNQPPLLPATDAAEASNATPGAATVTGADMDSGDGGDDTAEGPHWTTTGAMYGGCYAVDKDTAMVEELQPSPHLTLKV